MDLSYEEDMMRRPVTFSNVINSPWEEEGHGEEGGSNLQLASEAVANALAASFEDVGPAVAHHSRAPPPQPRRFNQESFETPKRKHRKLEVSATELLLREQVALVKKQLDVMVEIKDLMADRNRIEQEKFELKKRQYEQ